jgi:hypothetical protein
MGDDEAHLEQLPFVPRWYADRRADDADPQPPGGPDSDTTTTAPPPVDGILDDGADPTESARQVVRDARRALLGRDLIGPGPGLWPWGRRARARRARRREIDEHAQQRRRELRETFEQLQRPAVLSTRWRPVDRASNVRIITALTVVVTAIVAVAWWTSTRHRPATAAASASTLPISPSAPPTSTSGSIASQAAGATSLPALPPIPASGVTAISPPSRAAVDPASVTTAALPAGPPSAAELSTAEGAARAWVSHWCAFSFTEPLGAAERRAQPAMTDQAWPQFDPTGNERARASWQRTVVARESGQCAAPQALISPEAPRSDRSAVVIVTVDRLITSGSGTRYVEQLREARIVLRGDDGLWRVDTATVGG